MIESSSWTTAFDLGEKEAKLKWMEQQSQEQGFWDDPKQAGQFLKEVDQLKQEIGNWEKIKKEGLNIKGLLTQVDPEKEEELEMISDSVRELEKMLGQYEKIKLYSGKYDQRDAILSIHAGAGGVDAQDWAEMLLRMYLRYCERRGFRARIIDETKGSEAGLKSVSLEVSGNLTYGNLKAEAGVHRLVRLSPFNADNLRQTSFALVEVIPMLEKDSEVEIEPKDLRLDTFRSSGAGGQSVNKTDSAVRITHLPSGLVASCQTERSQAQNRQRAMSVLKAKLLMRKEQERLKEEKQIKGEHHSAEWGNQIRSYVLHPYQMVKDHRTEFETSDTKGVLDGQLDDFIEAYLRTF